MESRGKQAAEQLYQQTRQHKRFRHEYLSLSAPEQFSRSAPEFAWGSLLVLVFLFLVRLRRLIPQQAKRFPANGQNCKAKPAKERGNRAMETLQANINDPCKNGEPQHKEEHNHAV